jgi:hypothetical protein
MSAGKSTAEAPGQLGLGAGEPLRRSGSRQAEVKTTAVGTNRHGHLFGLCPPQFQAQPKGLERQQTRQLAQQAEFPAVEEIETALAVAG